MSNINMPEEISVVHPGCMYDHSVEDCPGCMARVIEKFIETRTPSRFSVGEVRQYEYDFASGKLLFEIADAIIRIHSAELLTLKAVSAGPECELLIAEKLSLLRSIVYELGYDPIRAYKRLVSEIRHTDIKIKKAENKQLAACLEHYSAHALQPMRKALERCELIQRWGKERGGREIYRRIFHPITRSSFMYTRFIPIPPRGAELLERYKVGNWEIEIYKVPGRVRKLYQLVVPEFRLEERDYSLLDAGRRYLGRHEPRPEELLEPQRFRASIASIAHGMLRDIAAGMGIRISEERLTLLADILARYTAGLGILELLLADEKIQDVLINSPIGSSPIYIMHGDHLECETNIIPSYEDGENWATRFRLQSGRPLDEANPVLDTELVVTGGRARVCAIARPLSPEGLGFAFRRHRERPWTLPLFIRARMIDAFSAGLLWFIIDGARTLLVAGTRGSGKTSFLGACMVQIMPKIRQICCEDTLELPVVALRDIGYNIERMKARSVITRIETELPAEDALRTALRLGDSALILGEVRSREALALYEAMRIGALANVVAGTIHGESAYGVFDRVVHDLGVPATSFKATDLILICNTLRSPDMLQMYRRVTELTEVRKHWTEDPALEGGFFPLLEYSAKDDMLKPSPTLLMGESEVLSGIANRVREWKANWPAVWDNINLRARVLATLVEHSGTKPDLLEAPAVMQSISAFHTICDSVRTELGSLDSKVIFERWSDWLKTKK